MGGEQTDDEVAFVDELPSALDADLATLLAGRSPAVFLDYDGTLSAITEHPDQAVLPDATRSALEGLAATHPVAIVSGRDRTDVQGKVALDDLYYAGSHGFDISGPDGFSEQRGAEYRSVLGLAADELESRAGALDGVWVERKRYAVAVHFRQAAPETETEVRKLVDDVARAHPALKASGGKKIFELRPKVDWDKGRAVLWLLEVLDLSLDRYLPVYVGDDETDEDAFRVLGDDRGVGVAVGTSRRTTHARLALTGPEEVAAFLRELARHP